MVSLAGLILSLRSDRLPLRSQRLRAALLANSITALGLALQEQGPQWRWLPVVELVRYGCWLIAVPALGGFRSGSWFIWINLLLWTLAALIALLSPVLGLLILAFAGLLNVEQLLRNAAAAEMHGIKLCVIALGAIFAWDLYFYSDFALMAAPDAQMWALRGFLHSAMLLLLLLGVARLNSTAPVLFISRQAVFFSTAFLAVGLYLVVVALGALYLRAQGGNWTAWLRPLLLAGAGVVLMVLLVSESPRRRLRVFLAKHFYRNKYDYRLEWLRFVGTLASMNDGDARVTSTRAIAQILESPGALLFLYDESTAGYTPVAAWGLDSKSRQDYPEPIAAENEMIRFMKDREWVIDLDEYRRAPSVYQSIQLPAFLARPHTNWLVVTPLLERDMLRGVIVLQRPPGPFSMTYEDRDLLRTVGRHVATLLAQQAADERLAQSRQFDAFNRFAAFVMHDLKNSAAQLQLLASNAARHRHNSEFIDDAFVTIENTATRITRLIAQLRSGEVRAGRQDVDGEKILELAVSRCKGRAPQPVLETAGGRWRVTADPERLASVFEQVLRNAQDAAGAGGEVRVQAESSTEGHLTVTISDTGPGMDPEFVRNRLFRPFDSTKGATGMGVGAYQARAYVIELGGTMEVRTAPGSGTRFIIRIPQCRTDRNSSAS